MDISPNVRCQLTEWGLPPLIISWFRKKGITKLFEWQVECLCKNDVLFGGNLVYSAPTSAGKTLVADFLLLKRVLEYQKKALVIEPFVALTREKATTLKSMLYTTKVRVGAFGGSYYTPGGMAAVHVAVCTIEKANNFINKLINENKLSDLGIIVVDEIHYLGDEKRGHQLELLLTKVLYHNSLQDKNKKIQIVGLSATIPNLESIAVWLNASLYITSYRPVPLVEKIKIGKQIYDVTEYLQDAGCDPIETICSIKMGIERDFDDLCYLCIDSLLQGFSNLVFCESKRECEVMAGHLANQIKLSGNKLESKLTTHVEMSKKLRANLSRNKILDVIEKLKKCPAGADKEIIKTLGFGVAYHHAGLTSEEREIIEDGFRGGAIKTLMATSTLSSGVNLPARRVIIRSPTMFYGGGSSYTKEMLNPITYRQMIGRAGRKNIDTHGESILVCRPDNQDIALKLIKASLGDIKSSLEHRMVDSDGEASGLKKAVLEVIANNTAKTRLHLNQYLQSTFWLSCSTGELEKSFTQAITETIRFLITKKFIEELKPGVYRSTRLGNAVLAAGLHPDESLDLLQDLIKARQGFCLLNDLHIIYQVTPNDIARSVDLRDWQHYSKIWNDLDDVSQSVGERVGIDEIVIGRRCQGFTGSLTDEKERVYRRFWVALVINDLISEIALPKICLKYRMSKALVQQVQRGVAQYAGIMTIFCEGLGYDNIAALVKPLESRINFSCQRDLLDLIRLNITRPIARALHKADYRNVISVAKADKFDIEFVIRQMKPFKKDSSFSQATLDPPSMWVPELAKSLTTLDYASHIVDTARNFVEIEYEIELAPAIVKRKDDGDSFDDTFDSSIVETKVLKRGRIEEDRQTEGEIEPAPGPSGYYPLYSGDMVKTKRDIPNCVVEYVGDDSRDIDQFMEKWIVHSSISLNFKLVHHTKQLIGAKIKGRRRSSARSDEEREALESNLTASQIESQEGLELKLDIDNKRHIMTRLYACFDDESIVYIIDNRRAFKRMKDKLGYFLENAATTSTPKPMLKLYTQNIVLTYKVLYAAFGLDRCLLRRHFEWHAFDVAWWMVNDCPNRGLNNRNSSLSLVAKTSWAKPYHHFLHPSSPKAKRRSRGQQPIEGQTLLEVLKMKDIFKAGKTAILQPLITEILIELKARQQFKAYSHAEIPSRLAMAHMMIHGMGLDMKSLKDELILYDELSTQLIEIAQKEYAKKNISLTSPKQIARVLYEDLNLKQYLVGRALNTDLSRDSTNSEILSILSAYHPFPKLIQDYRKIGKAQEALQAVNTHARHNPILDMTRIFGLCDFWQLTGRVAMSDPDLFLINRNFTILVPAHRHRAEEEVECAPRRCFVPSSGWVYIAADYSQLELRLLAHFADDANLLEILNRSSKSDQTYDVFKTMASKVYKKSVNEVTDEDRQHAKKICYGLIYGMGNRSLANSLGVEIEQAEDFRNDFLDAFPRISHYTEELIKDCEQVGYVESLLNRRRVIEGIDSENSSLRSKAERVTINTRIQSSASDIIKLAMHQVDQKILENYSTTARLVLEMHDELIYEVSPNFSTIFAKTLKFTMEGISETEGLKVKLLVNLKKGLDWSSLEDFNPFKINDHI